MNYQVGALYALLESKAMKKAMQAFTQFTVSVCCSCARRKDA